MFSLISDQTFIFQRSQWNLHQAELTQAELTQGRLDSRADLTSGDNDNLAQKYVKKTCRAVKARKNTYCKKTTKKKTTVNTNKKAQTIVDRKETKQKKHPTDGRWKRGTITLSVQAEEANMILHISAFLQKRSLL